MKLLLTLVLSLLGIAQASAKETVTVYTSRKEHLVKDIFQKFENETGIKVNYRTGKAGALIQTLKSEGENSPADIFMTVDETFGMLQIKAFSTQRNPKFLQRIFLSI
ncbi:MAG: substrate-binding domain-containing protein [Bacteriovoracaceae bacterium]